MATVHMSPAPGTRLIGFVGDRLRFSLRHNEKIPAHWKGLLRTNLGGIASELDTLIATHGEGQTFASASWRDIAMERHGDEWIIELTLTCVGYFRAKPYAVDEHFHQHWPDGDDIGISIHPDAQRSANTIYCAFVRAFGQTKHHRSTRHGLLEEQFSALDKHGYTLIPPSGTLRDLTAQIPHIVDTLGCRIIHLLPICTTPTTYARMGRYGSPYAATDLTAIDPALVVFDQRTTAVEQFRELTYAAHLHGAQVFIDLAINHTGWGSRLMEQHPEWFMRNSDGTFKSPGAWGVTWGDLVELEHHHNFALWDECAEAFLTWCRRGVDGFRCDAGYMVPKQAWQYITAQVRREFPDVIFLLEGLGGAWQATETLLTEGGMQWAYSELFQNYSGREVAHYLDHALYQSARIGTLVHYSETHDNDRLAKGGKTWSLMRNYLSALTSTHGAFGFTCGVEWLASEKIDVHESRGLSWNNSDNIVSELSQLNALLCTNPCFFDGVQVQRLSGDDSPIYVLRRISAEGLDQVLILINTDTRQSHNFILARQLYQDMGSPTIDLLRSDAADAARVKPDLHADTVQFTLAAGQCLCLATTREPRGLAGEAYRAARARAAWAIGLLSQFLLIEEIGPFAWDKLAELVYQHPAAFAGCLHRIDKAVAKKDLLAAITTAMRAFGPPQAATWNGDKDATRILPVAHHYALLIRDSAPFQVALSSLDEKSIFTDRSIPVIDGHIACIPKPPAIGRAKITLHRYCNEGRTLDGLILFLPPVPLHHQSSGAQKQTTAQGVALLTNGIGGMARLHVDFSHIASKYDCLLGANLHPRVPCDRHVLIKRLRLWINANGFIVPLNGKQLVEFIPGPPARWIFVGYAGNNQTVTIHLIMDMLDGKNAVVMRLERPDQPALRGTALPAHAQVRISARFDLEDRSFHCETQRNNGSDSHFEQHTRTLTDAIGFEFAPSSERRVRVTSSTGHFNRTSEWCLQIPHTIDAERGHAPTGDAWSPGWFDLPINIGEAITLVANADQQLIPQERITNFITERENKLRHSEQRAGFAPHDHLGQALARAAASYVVRRDELKTVIAGYPWFLDWGRDSLICARGLIAAGMLNEVRDLLITFGRFEQHGTLPNNIHGEDASNRETSDAPLWYGIVCEELAEKLGNELYDTKVNNAGRTIADVITSIAKGYLRGAPNGVRVDRVSGLVFSPAHFTWMDTNHPAGTPREGYPIEIQVLWIRLLRHLEKLGLPAADEPWWAIADRAQKNIDERYWIEERGYYADLLIAKENIPAADAVRDNALRSNQILTVALGLVTGERARRSVVATARYLFVPGALRSLAPLPIDPPLPVYGNSGQLLNDPVNPYWGHYTGDEDTRRKPAYHNGTAWTWTFPGACEAVARAWDFAPSAVETAKAYLGSIEYLLRDGCHGHLPEIIDGDAPHTQRGCDAQAWGATEALRVWKLLSEK
jgi:starch synthase (maltosyl-transferring)